MDQSRQDRLRHSPDTGRIFSIAPGIDFLRTLAETLVDGRLIEGFRPIDDPLALPGATVYLPTRRAARVFSAEIIRALGGRAALMPAIRTLGDSDEEEFDLAFSVRETAELPPAAGALERQFTLAKLVRGWTSALSQASREKFGDEDIVIPSSASDALWLASDLAGLLDQIETEEIAWSALGETIEAEHAAWWDLTATFLKIVAEYWPEHLRQNGKIDPAQARRTLLDFRSKQLKERPSSGPVIAAGSTGSIPATARLLETISQLDNGAIVLPGVDFDLPDEVWRHLSEAGADDDAPVLSTHPQYGLAKLLARLGIARDAIRPLGEAPPDIRSRRAMIGLAMLPAPETGRWSTSGNGSAGQQDDDAIAVIEAPGEREEALAIALALREALEDSEATAALTTPDRALARRVAAELGRWGIEIDDSAGTPLDEAPAGRLALLVSATATGPADPVMLTALLKHPAISRGAVASGAWAKAARSFERVVLRGALVVPVPGELEQVVERARAVLHRHRSVNGTNLDDEDWEAMLALAAHVDRACAGLHALRDRHAGMTLAEGLGTIRVALDLLLAHEDSEGLADLTGGRELIRLFDTLDALAVDGADGPSGGMVAPPHELSAIFRSIARNVTVREVRHPHPRLFIWGPLEARLQSVDLMILGGLNEGSWPTAVRNDPFLNRPMRGAIGLSYPERRIGQSAHDFEQLSGARRVIYSRALKADNAPTVASRWLQRLMAVAGEESAKRMLARGRGHLDMARMVDAHGDGSVRRAQRPCPRPAVALRPKGLTITEIETWIRDPYAIHAKHVLGLRPLDPLEREADPALRGTLYHEALARFVREGMPEETPEAALSRLTDIAKAVFDKHFVPVEIAASWLPRFVEIGRAFIAWEHGRAADIAQSLCEVSGEIEVGANGFVLRGRADRIDRMNNDGIALFDYKTGTNPSITQARIFSPQLSLEGRMAELGGFGDDLAAPVEALAYVRLRAGDVLKVDDIAGGRDPVPVRDLVARTWAELEKLVAAYENESQGYLSRYAVMREGEVGGDYDHLARVREWSLGEAEDDG